MTQSKLSAQLIKQLSCTLDPSEGLIDVGFNPYAWQHEGLHPGITRLMLMCARQSGKSTVSAGKCYNKAKYQARSLNIITSPTEKQSQETMKKVDDYIAADPDLADGLLKDSAFEKEFRNGSRIVALPGTEKSVRGYSGPKTIVIDEASRLEDETYFALRPMLTGNVDGELMLLSTPFGKRGFFYREWVGDNSWTKILVKPRYTLMDDMVTFEEELTDKQFKDLYAKDGISAYYSPRHTLEWLKEELESIGAMAVKREYNCEFLEDSMGMFNMSLIDAAMTNTVDTYYDEKDRYDAQVKTVDFLDDLFAPKTTRGHKS